MKKLILGVGLVVILTTFGFLMYGDLDITRFGAVNSAVLGLLYGWYNKLQANEDRDEKGLIILDLEYVIKERSEISKYAGEISEVCDFLDYTNKKLENENEILRNKLEHFQPSSIIPKLEKNLEKHVEKELVKDKPARKPRVKKVKEDKK